MLSLPPRSPDEPKSHWLYRSLRDAILDGRLRAGDRLPASRELAKTYSVSRGIVVEVYEQLNAEGFTEGRFGAGTTVTSYLAEPPPSGVLRNDQHEKISAPPDLSGRGAALDALVKRDAHRLPDGFSYIRMPGVDLFPAKAWSQRMGRLLVGQDDLLAASCGVNEPNFQRAVAAYLRSTRSVVCEPEQIFAAESMGHGLIELMHLLLSPGDTMWMEDPGQAAILPLSHLAGLNLVPVPVDAAGFDVRVALRHNAEAKLTVVTPEHQDLFGTTMTFERRVALLDWAEKSNGWIFEADYESEYRYAGRPTTSLQGLGSGRRVFYAGSYESLLFPGVRTSFIVVPPQFVEIMQRRRLCTMGGPPALIQATIASFIESGDLDRHLRRMREAYRARLRALRAAVEQEASDLLTLANIDGGMSVVGWLQAGIPGALAAAEAQRAGLRARSVADFVYARAPLPEGLLIGFASLPPTQAPAAVARFASALRGKLTSL